MKLHLFRDRRRVYFKLWVYQTRLAKMRQTHGLKNGYKGGKEYMEASKNLKYRIRQFKRILAAIDARQASILQVARQVRHFLNINVQGKVSNAEPKYKLVRGIFYKYCLETGIHSALVSEFVGSKRGHTASEGRKTFTKSFNPRPENRELYQNFKQFAEEQS